MAGFPPMKVFLILISKAQDTNRQMEEKLKQRDAEIWRLREATRSLQTNFVGSSLSRRQSTRATSSSDNNFEAEQLKSLLEEKEQELSVKLH